MKHTGIVSKLSPGTETRTSPEMPGVTNGSTETKMVAGMTGAIELALLTRKPELAVTVAGADGTVVFASEMNRF
jgi:hypothetical protein